MRLRIFAAPALLPSAKIRKLAAAIAGVLDDPAAARGVATGARRHALAHYDWNTIVDRVPTIYRGEVA